VWLATGCSRGLGRHLADAVLAAGHRLVATARDPATLEPLRAEYGDRVRTVALDVTDGAAARAAVDTAVTAFGRLDVLVNNAGQASVGSIEDTPDRDFLSQVDVTYGGVVRMTRAALPVMREQRRGLIVQVSSVGGRMGTPGLGAYQSAKAAVTTFSQVLAKEVAPLGIAVTVLEPGSMRTDMTSPASMAILPFHPDYESTVGAVGSRLRRDDGTQPGDPARVAQLIVGLPALEHPPVRLVVGSDALGLARRAAQALSESEESWKTLSSSVDSLS
jgi:NAD(P)-dependent dehydrogenase (short-subunit alcohol dehydrogenase family)